MAIRELTTKDFDATVDAPGIVLIDWWAPWCGPCRAFAPVYERVAAANPDIVFTKVNTDEQPELGSAYQIRSIPTLMMFRDGVLLFAQPGMLPAAGLTDLIEQARTVDMDMVRKKLAEELADESGPNATH